MLRRSLVVLGAVFFAASVQVAHAGVTYDVTVCDGNPLPPNCDGGPYTGPPVKGTTYQIDVMSDTAVQAIRIPKGWGSFIDTGAVNAGWKCDQGIADQFSSNPLDIRCTRAAGPVILTTPLTFSVTIYSGTPGNGQPLQAWGGYAGGVFNAPVSVSKGDDIPSTIDAGCIQPGFQDSGALPECGAAAPAISVWGALGLVLLLLGTMSWILWPRIGRNETA